MRLSLSATFLTIVVAARAEGSFTRDVVRGSHRLKANNRLDDALFAKAVPLKEYRANMRSRGLNVVLDSRELQENVDGMDDYFMDESYMTNFSGYSLKYATCQPVQKFSEDAITAGEYTPMVTDDIVVLRLCQSNSCNSKREFGCGAKFVDYAISVSDYLRIMIRHKLDKQENLCNWCNSCAGQRRLEDIGDDQGEEVDDQQEAEDNLNQGDEQEDAVDEEEMAQGDDAQNAAVGDDNVAGYDDDLASTSSSCSGYASYCFSDGVSVCAANGDDSTGYLDTQGYLNYLSCQHINGYYLRPRCNGYEKSISMGIYYDKFCSQYAGDKVNLNSILGGLGIEPYAFREFYESSSCIDCSESVCQALLLVECENLLLRVPHHISCVSRKRVLVLFTAPTRTCVTACIVLLPCAPAVPNQTFSIHRFTTMITSVLLLKCFEREPTTKKAVFSVRARSVAK